MEICPYDIDKHIKSSLSADVLEGLKYLHNRGIIHGSLTSLNCYLDVTWCVKVGGWELKSMESDQIVSKGSISLQILPESEEALIKLLYADPESIKSKEFAYETDIYSLGVVLIEIFTKKLPYYKEVE